LGAIASPRGPQNRGRLEAPLSVFLRSLLGRRPSRDSCRQGGRGQNRGRTFERPQRFGAQVRGRGG
jgi:hypothetical protein